jgi:hypothetical protein
MKHTAHIALSFVIMLGVVAGLVVAEMSYVRARLVEAQEVR